MIALAAIVLLVGRGGGDAVDGSARLAIARAPLAFEPNAGRLDPSVDFAAHSVAGGSLFLGRDGARLSLPSKSGPARSLRLGLLGAAGVAPVALGELPGKANSFIGDDRSRWRSGIPTFDRVRYRSVYPGVDLDFHGNQSQLEYDFRLAPGADPGAIALGLEGADSLRIGAGGDLAMRVGGHTVRQLAPVAFQPVGGERRRVPVAFDLRGETLRFRLGAFDHSRPLVIDPVLTYSSYLGGGSEDFGFDVVVDSKGAAYVSGPTASGNFPVEDEAYPDQANKDVFVAKFDPTAGGGMALAYSTYIGASLDDFGAFLAVDGIGAVYLAGTTASKNFPTVDPLAGAAGGDLGSFDTFVVKISPDTGGTVGIEYSTYVSGSISESGGHIAVDDSGAAYVTGSTDSPDFPLQDQFQGDQKDGDGFLFKLNPHAGGPVTLAYSTYLGGAGNNDRLTDVAVDDEGAAYISGLTDSTDFPTQDPFQGDKGLFDALVIKVNPDSGGAVSLAYSTYISGGKDDDGISIAVDDAGAAYLMGNTDSFDLVVNNGFQTDQPKKDVFVFKLEPDSGGAVGLDWSTYLGGSLDDSGASIALGPEGNAYVAGSTVSTDFPTQGAVFGDSAERDGFVTELEEIPEGQIVVPFSTYFGGSGTDEANAVAVDRDGAILLAGSTSSADFPLRGQLQGDQPEYDAFLARLAEPPAAPPGGPGQGGGAGVRPPAAVDTAAPETTITKRPKKKLTTAGKRARVVFRFGSSEPGSSFECARDRGAFSACASPQKYRAGGGDAPLKHRFRVRAIDAAGNADPSPAAARFSVIFEVSDRP